MRVMASSSAGHVAIPVQEVDPSPVSQHRTFATSVPLEVSPASEPGRLPSCATAVPICLSSDTYVSGTSEPGISSLETSLRPPSRSKPFASTVPVPLSTVEKQPLRPTKIKIGLKTRIAEPEPMGLIEWVATVGSILILVLTFPLSLCASFKVVQEYERAVIFRLGRLRKGGPRGPGIFFILPCIDTYCKVDLRTVSFDVPPQEVLTKDSVTVTVDAVIYYNIKDPLSAVVQVSNYSHSTRLLAATTLRNVLGTKNLSEILSERETIAHTMQASLDEATDPWGVKVERVEIKDVRLPVQLQRAMAAEAEATREARAKVIAAEGEMKASRALKEASDVIGESPAALQLRYLQTLNTISAEKNSTIIFPLPMDLVTSFMGHRK